MTKRISKRSREELLSVLGDRMLEFTCKYGSSKDIIDIGYISDVSPRRFDEVFAIILTRKFPPIAIYYICQSFLAKDTNSYFVSQNNSIHMNYILKKYSSSFNKRKYYRDNTGRQKSWRI